MLVDEVAMNGCLESGCVVLGCLPSGPRENPGFQSISWLSVGGMGCGLLISQMEHGKLGCQALLSQPALHTKWLSELGT